MKNLQLKKSSTFLSLLACLLLVCWSINCSVLCFGEDGHIKVETALIGSNCGSSLSTTSQATSYANSMMSGNSTRAHCSSCVDIPLFPDFLNRCVFSVHNRVPLVKAQLIATFSFVQSTFAGMLASVRSLQPNDNHSPLTFIRSVILLI